MVEDEDYRRKAMIAVVAIVVLASLAVFATFVAFAYYCYISHKVSKRRCSHKVEEANANLNEKSDFANLQVVAEKGLKVFTFKQLHSATGGFSKSNVVGHGGFGLVYRGVLNDGRKVAIKLMDQAGKQGEEEFKVEVELLSRLHSPYLLALLGYCSDHNHKLLVYEFMANGGLQEHLYPVSNNTVNCAVNGRSFEVVYYPRASTPEFCVKVSSVKSAMQIQWCSGMRFKMPFETEDSSRISWFMGTISSVHVQDPIRWPDSPWRLLQVVWDEPDLLQNVKCVNPWLVELVSNMPNFNLSPFTPPRKKPRFIQDPYFHLINQLPTPTPSSSPSISNINLLNYTKSSLCNIQDTTTNSSLTSSIQGARHAQFGPNNNPSDLIPFNKLLQQDMFLGNLSLSRFNQQQPITRPPYGPYKSINNNTKNNVDLSCLLSVGNSGQSFKESNIEAKAPHNHILLFGKIIHTEQNSSKSGSVSEGTSLKTSNASSSDPVENFSDGGSPWYKDQQHKPDLVGTEHVTTLCMAS